MIRKMLPAICAMSLISVVGCSNHEISTQTNGQYETSQAVSISQQAFEKLDEVDKRKIQRATPVQIIELFVEGVNNDKPYLRVATLDDELLQSVKTLEQTKDSVFSGIKMSKVTISEDKQSKEPDTDNIKHFMLQFTVDSVTPTNSPGFEVGGPYTYFVKCVQHNRQWKINALATSP